MSNEVVNQSVHWKEAYVKVLKRTVIDTMIKKSELSKTVRMPIIALKKTVANKSTITYLSGEISGMTDDLNHALILATPTAKPMMAGSARTYQFDRLQSTSEVWVGCFVGMAVSIKSVINLAIYRVSSVELIDVETKEAVAVLELTSHREYDGTNWTRHMLDTSKLDMFTKTAIFGMESVLTEKVLQGNSFVPFYIEYVRSIQHELHPKIDEFIQETITERVNDIEFVDIRTLMRNMVSSVYRQLYKTGRMQSGEYKAYCVITSEFATKDRDKIKLSCCPFVTQMCGDEVQLVQFPKANDLNSNWTISGTLKEFKKLFGGAWSKRHTLKLSEVLMYLHSQAAKTEDVEDSSICYKVYSIPLR